MKNKFLFVLSIFIFVSCSKHETDILNENSPEPIAKEVYIFKEIKYVIEEGDGEEIIIEKMRGLEYVNKTSVTQSVIIDPLAGIEDISLFKSFDNDVLPLAIDSVFVHIPIDITNGDISLGGTKRFYSNSELYFPSVLNLKDTVYVDPNKKLIVAIELIISKYISTYEAVFYEEKTAKEITVRGKWSGWVTKDAKIKKDYIGF